MKYLLPYIKRFAQYHEERYSRITLDRKCGLGDVYRISLKWYHSLAINSFTTKEAAMKDLDERLVFQGYKLLTHEQAEKLKVLL